MTCIVGLVSGSTVWMGADSAGVAGYAMAIRRDPKIYRSGDFLLGFTSSFRMGQLLGHKLKVPKHYPDCSTEQFMVTTFIDAVRDTLKSGGYARSVNGEEVGGEFLVGYRGRLFKVCSDFQVGECHCGFDATGCGQDIALGALYATDGQPPQARIESALKAAEAFSAGVRAPFITQTLEATEVPL